MPVENALLHGRLREQYVADPRPRAMGYDLGLLARRKDGSTFPVEISLTPLPTDDGPWVLAAVVDITPRRAAEDRVRALSDAHLALAELNAAILHAQSPEELYDAACRVVGRVSDELGVFVAQSTGDGLLEVVAHVGETGPVGADPTGIATDLPGLTGVLTTGKVWLCADVAAETSGSWRTWALEAGVTAVAGLALRRAGRPVAVLVVHAARRELIEDQFVAVLETMADNLSFALDRLATQERMHRVDGQRLELLGRLVAAQEQERARIAGDVHDHSVQALAALDLRLGMHRRQLDLVAPDLVPSVDALHAGLVEVVAELRHLLFDLEVADEGVALVDQLRDALEHVFEAPGTERILDVRDPARADLPPDLRLQAVRIFKEALGNVRPWRRGRRRRRRDRSPGRRHHRPLPARAPRARRDARPGRGRRRLVQLRARRQTHGPSLLAAPRRFGGLAGPGRPV